MENYWFIYEQATGKIVQTYLGYTDEWTNVPEGCGVIGPLNGDSSVKDAFDNPDFYTVQGVQLVPVGDIDAKKAAREADRQKQQSAPTLLDEIANLKKQNANFALIFAKHNMK